jgi:hypothetical protein
MTLALFGGHARHDEEVGVAGLEAVEPLVEGGIDRAPGLVELHVLPVGGAEDRAFAPIDEGERPQRFRLEVRLDQRLLEPLSRARVSLHDDDARPGRATLEQSCGPRLGPADALSSLSRSA